MDPGICNDIPQPQIIIIILMYMKESNQQKLDLLLLTYCLLADRAGGASESTPDPPEKCDS